MRVAPLKPEEGAQSSSWPNGLTIIIVIIISHDEEKCPWTHGLIGGVFKKTVSGFNVSKTT
jgi:hypothetical protein